MDQLFSTLFNQPFGTDTGLQVALSALSTLLTAVALMVRTRILSWACSSCFFKQVHPKTTGSIRAPMHCVKPH